MKYLLFSLLFLTISTCQKEEVIFPPEIPFEDSVWVLNEVLYDPGDGSATWNSVNNDREIQLMRDGTFTATGDLCDLSWSNNTPSSGQYSLENNYFIIEDCWRATVERPLFFAYDGVVVTINYGCAEGCLQRYVRRE